MHSGLLPGLLLALAGGLLGTATTDTHGAVSLASSPNSANFYSIMAQTPATATVETVVTPTLEVTGTAAVTATESISATGTVTATATRAAAAPLPTTQPPGSGSLRINPFDGDFLFSAPPNPQVGPLGWFALLVMLGLLAGGIYLLLVKRPQWKRTNSVLYRAVNRFAQPMIWLGAIGILLLIFRWISLDFFNLRFWLYLWALALLGVIGWFVYWYRTSYPKEVAKFQKTQKARQYMPGSKASRAAQVTATPGATSSTTGTTTTTTATRPAGTSTSTKSAQRSKNRKRR
jgi:hypothetical protein